MTTTWPLGAHRGDDHRPAEFLDLIHRQGLRFGNSLKSQVAQPQNLMLVGSLFIHGLGKGHLAAVSHPTVSVLNRLINHTTRLRPSFADAMASRLRSADFAAARCLWATTATAATETAAKAAHRGLGGDASAISALSRFSICSIRLP